MIPPPELAAILAVIRGEPDHTGRVWSPDEDAPRLVCADWLSEHDEPERGEFIRVQCELAKLMTIRDGEFLFDWGSRQSVPALRDRAHRLWTRIGLEWFDHFGDWFCCALNPAGACGKSLHGFPDRGFLSRVRCSWSDWSRHGDSILADPWVPGLDEVELTTWPELQSTRNQARRFYELTVVGMKQFPYIVSDLELENIHYPGIFREAAVIHAARHRWQYDIDGKKVAAVRSWKLPPPERTLQSEWPTGEVDDLPTNLTVAERTVRWTEPSAVFIDELLCNCPRCSPGLYNGCVRCGRLERFDRPHNCRPRMLVTDEWPCRAVLVRPDPGTARGG